jgi:ABC-type transport system substrate-binding protein
MAYPVGEIIYSDDSANPPVAVASISTFYKVTEPVNIDTVELATTPPTYGVAAGAAVSYNIVFVCGQNKIVWKYAVQADRDNCYNAIISNYGYKPD